MPQRYPTPAEDADGQNMDPPMAAPPREHPLPHDEISSACSAGNVTLGAGKGSRGGVFVLNLRLDDKPSLIVLWLS